MTQILLAAEAVQDLAAGIHRKAYQDYFRLLSRVFPYAVYYTREKEAVTVWAVLDCRRDPAWIADHLKGKAKS